MFKLTVFVPETHVEPVKAALFEAGAGRLGGYDRCSWQTAGMGQFRPLPGSRPFLGRPGEVEQVAETRVEMLCPDAARAAVEQALRRAHPYEQPAYDFVALLSPPSPDRLEACATRVRAAIRDVPDFPKPGILFKDITPVLADAALLRDVIALFAERYAGQGITQVAAIDARGFLFAGALAVRLGAGVVPLRKAGKLPRETWSESYGLEYGEARLAIHTDACGPSDHVLLFDDLLATGGTAEAACRLIARSGAALVGVAVLVELAFLKGRERLAGIDVFAPVVY